MAMVWMVTQFILRIILQLLNAHAVRGLLSIEISNDIPEEFISSAKCCHCGVLNRQNLLNQYVFSNKQRVKAEILKSYGF